MDMGCCYSEFHALCDRHIYMVRRVWNTSIRADDKFVGSSFDR